MVCKEDVLLWFKDLESYKRIDVMNELLNMCIPFEVRFLGSCIEEIGKHTYQELRGPNIFANDVEKLSKDSTLQMGLLNEVTRHRTVIYMSVLSARNCLCANWFYTTLFRTERLENYVNSGCKNDNSLTELLLLFTLGLYHPAFTFDQKMYCGKQLQKLIDQSEGYKYGILQNEIFISTKNISSLSMEPALIPVKTPIMHGTDNLLVQHPPPGLPPPPHHLQHPPVDYMSASILGATFQGPGHVCAPEVHHFSQPVLPLVSQNSSPHQSRSTSPHGIFPKPLSTSGVPLPTNPALLQIHAGEPLSPNLSGSHLERMLSHTQNVPFSSFPEAISINATEDETIHNTDEKIRETSWFNSQLYEPIKPISNGLRVMTPRHLLNEQIQNLKLDSDSCLHHSSSTSSNSSVTQSPTETPSVTPAVTPHGPGRGAPELKSRVNGVPTQLICEMNVTPFSNCSVPYSISHVAPNRYYPYRPPFTQPFSYQPSEIYPFPYFIYSSMIPPPPTRTPNCYNCGALGHNGVDCTGRTIDDITQKPYVLEYDFSTAPDNPNDK